MARKHRNKINSSLRAQNQRDRKIRVGLTVVVVLFAVALVAYIVVPSNNPDAGDVKSIRVSATSSEGAEPKAVVSVFEDFLCPHCGTFERTFGATIIRLIDSGVVAMEYTLVAILDSPQNRDYSSRAANAAPPPPPDPEHERMGRHPVGAVSARAHRRPILLDNDANVIVLSERRGQRDRFDDMLLIKASTGLGEGIVAGGVLQRGAVGGAGEFGHTKTPAAGVACRCGDTGCLEAIAGGWALVRTMQQQGHGVGHIRDRAGDPRTPYPALRPRRPIRRNRQRRNDLGPCPQRT